MVEHGNYEVEVNGNIIIVTFDGMFNELASKKLCAFVENLIDNLNGKDFCMLLNLLKYEGSTRDAHKEGNRHSIWLEGQNCLGKAIVTRKSAMLEIVRNEQTSLNKSSITSKVFTCEIEAKEWLLSL